MLALHRIVDDTLATFHRPSEKSELNKLFSSQENLSQLFNNVKLDALIEERQNLSKLLKDNKYRPQNMIVPKKFSLISATSWEWKNSKNPDRDWAGLLKSVLIESRFTEKYRPDMIASNAEVMYLRHSLQALLSSHSKLVNQLDASSSKRLSTTPTRQWTFPDGIESGPMLKPDIDILTLLEEREVHERRLAAKKIITSIVKKIETCPYSFIEDDGDKHVPLKMQEIVTNLIKVRIFRC